MRAVLIPVLLGLAAANIQPLAGQAIPVSQSVSRSTEIAALTPVQGKNTAWYSRVLSALGGAAIGAGVGFFASQVFTGDWEEAPGREVDRPAWAAVGGSIGFAVGFSFPVGGRGRQPQLARGLRGGRYQLNPDEWRSRSGINNALEAVRLYRPEWLNERGVHILTAPDEGVVVYLDDVRLGSVDTLRDLNIQIVRSMHYLDAGAATSRWGAGHSHGVILVVANGG
jgi:hypothetical protein